MFDPKPVGGTELPTNRTSVIGYARYTSSATEVKTKGGRANNTFDQTLRWPFLPHTIHPLAGTIPKKKRPEKGISYIYNWEKGIRATVACGPPPSQLHLLTRCAGGPFQSHIHLNLSRCVVDPTLRVIAKQDHRLCEGAGLGVMQLIRHHVRVL